MTWPFPCSTYRVDSGSPGSSLLSLNETEPFFPSTSVPDSQPHTAAAITTQSPSALICTSLTSGQSIIIIGPVTTMIKGDKILVPQLELPEGGGRPEVLHNPFLSLLRPMPSLSPPTLPSTPSSSCCILATLGYS